MTSQNLNAWATSDLPFYFRDNEEQNQGIREWSEFTEGFKKLSEPSIVGGRTPDISDSWSIDLETGELVRGVYDITTAMTHGSYSSYYGGMFEDNQARSKYSARMQLGAYKHDLYKGTALEFSEKDKKLLNHYASKSAWNLSRLGDPFRDEQEEAGVDLWDVPVFTNFNETPDNIMGRDAPEGWDPQQALEVLKLKDPQMYSVYLNTLGGRENVDDLLSETKNPYDFFYTLTNEMQQIAYMRTQMEWWKTASASEVVTEYVYNFVVEGIANDPDFAASMGISLGISAGTAGVGAIPSFIVAAAAKVLKTGINFAKFLKWTARLQNRMNQLQRYLPENLGPTLVNKIPQVKSFAQHGKFAQFSVNRLGDVGEGLITGGLAEIGNQYRQLDAGTLDSFSVTRVINESLIEAAFSPAVNPAIGGLYKGIGALGSLGSNQIAVPLANALLGENSVKGISNFVGKIGRTANPQALAERLELIEINTEIRAELEALTLEGTDIETGVEEDTDPTSPTGVISAVIASLFDETGMSKAEFLTSVKEILTDFREQADNPTDARRPKEGKEQEVVLAELAQELVNRNQEVILERNDGNKQVFANILGWTKQHITLAKQAAKKGMSYKDYVNQIIERGEEFNLVPNDIRKAVVEKLGEKFKDATTEERLEVAKEILQERIQEQKKAITEFNQRTDEGEAEADARDEDIDGIDPDPADPAPADPEPKPVDPEKRKGDDDPKDPGLEGGEGGPPARKRSEDPLVRREELKRKLEKQKRELEALKKKLEDRLKSDPDPKIKEKVEKVRSLVLSVEKQLETVTVDLNQMLADHAIDNAELKPLVNTLIDLRDRLHKISEDLKVDQEDDKGVIWSYFRAKRFEALLTKLNRLYIEEGEGGNVKSADISPELRQTLEDIKKELKDDNSKTADRMKQYINGVLAGTEKQMTPKTISQYLVRGGQVIKSHMERLEKTDLYKENSALVKEFNKTLRDYKRVIANIQRGETLNDIQKFFAIQLQQTGARAQRKETEVFEAKEKLFNDMIGDKEAEGETVTVNELLPVLHQFSEWRQNKEAVVEENPEKGEKEYTIEEAKEIFGKEAAAVKQKIKTLSIGKLQNLRAGGRYSYIRGDYEHNYNDSDVLGTSYDPEYVLERSNEDGKELDPETVDDTAEMIVEPEGLDDMKQADLNKFIDDVMGGEGGKGGKNKDKVARIRAWIANKNAEVKPKRTGPAYLPSPTVVYETLDAADGSSLFEDSFDVRNAEAREVGFEDYFHAVNSYNLYVIGIHKNKENFAKAAKGIGRKEIKEAWDARSKLSEKQRDAAKAQKINLVKQMKKELRTEDIVFTRSLDKDVEAWIQFEAALDMLATKADPTKGIAAWRINQAMPAYLRDYVGLKPYVVFGRENVLGKSHSALMPSDVVDIDMASATDRQVVQHTLRYRPEELLNIARAWKERGVAKIDGWQKQELANVLDTLEAQAMDESNPNSAANLYYTIAFIERLESASELVNRELFKMRQEKRDGGWIMEVDGDTGFPIKFTKDESTWIGDARGHIRDRINSLIERRQTRSLRNIAEKFGLTLEEQRNEFHFPTYVITDAEGNISDNVADVIIESMRTELEGLHEGQLSLTKLGNGEYGYGSSKNVGYAVVDFLSDKEMPSIQSLTAITDKDGKVIPAQADEDTEIKGQPTNVRLPIEGEVNHAMPIPAMKLAALVSNYKARERMRFILGKEKFTPKEREAYKAWVEAKWSDIKSELKDPDPTGEQVPFAVIPQIVGNRLHEQVMKRSEVKAFIMELLLDVPRNAEGFIHDQVTRRRGSRLMFNEGMEEGIVQVVDRDGNIVDRDIKNLDKDQGLMVDLSHGDHILVPLGRIGEILAIEAMGPMFKGLTSVAVEEVMKLRDKREADGTGTSINDFLSNDNWSDRVASGVFEMKLMSLANDPNATIEVDGKKMTAEEIMNGILDGTFKRKEKTELDFYMRGAITAGRNNTDTSTQIGKIFELIKKRDIKTMDDIVALEELGKTDEDAAKDSQEIAKLRGVFKVPILRRIYGGGQKNFDEEFAEGGKGYDAMKESGIEPSTENIAALKKILFSKIGVSASKSYLIDVALGVDEKTKKLVHSYLRIEQERDKPLLEAWKNLMDMDNKTLSKELENSITHIDLLDKKLRQLYRLDKSTMTFEEWKKVKGYDERFEAAKKFLTEKHEAGDAIHPGTDNYAEFKRMVSGVGGKLTAESIGYLRALNILNSQEYRINAERIKNAAELLGLKDFDITDYLGFEAHAVYQVMLPSGNSGRTYNTRNMGLDTLGISLERVARVSQYTHEGITYESFSDFLESGAAPTDKAVLTQLFEDFLAQDSDNADALGAYDLADPFLRDQRDAGKTDEELEQIVEDLMIKQEMLLWSSYDRPPSSVFPDYTVEDSDVGLLGNILREWYSHSEGRHESLRDEMRREMDHWNREGENSKFLALKNKSGGLVNKKVVDASNGAYRYTPYHVSENNPTSVMLHTAGQRGPLAMRPKYKESQYHDVGFFGLQKLHIQERLERLLGPLHTIRRNQRELSDEEVMVGGTNIGGFSPWNAAELPQVIPTLPANMAAEVGTPAGVRAAQLYYETHMWATERGLQEQLEADPENFARFYIIREIERTRQDIHRRVREDDVIADSDVTAHRNAWVSGLHDVVRYSRDIKNPEPRRKLKMFPEGEQFAAVNPIADDLTYYENLTSVLSEDNPEGILLRRSILDGEFKMGQAPDFNLVIDLDEGAGEMNLFEFSDLTEDAWAVQNADFNKFLAAQLFTEAIGNALKNYKDGKYAKYAMRPDDWETEIGEGLTTAEAIAERQEILQMAREYVAALPSYTLEVGIEEVLYDDAKGRGKKTNKYRLAFKRPSGEGQAQKGVYGAAVGFGMTFMTSQKISATSGKFLLGEGEALKMFSILENAQTMEGINLSNWLNKGLGIKVAANGQVVRAVPLHERVADALGYSARPIRDAALTNSESISRASAGETGLSVVQMITAGGGLSVEGRAVTVVDLDYYARDGSGWDDGDLGTATFAWLESYISPVKKLIRMIDQSGINPASPLTAVRGELVALIAATREGDAASGIVLRLLALKLENPFLRLDGAGRKVEIFFSEKDRNAENWGELLQRADSLSTSIKTQISDEGVRLNNDLHYAAMQFIMLGKTDINSTDFDTLVENFREFLGKDLELTGRNVEEELQGALRGAVLHGKRVPITSSDSIFAQDWDEGDFDLMADFASNYTAETPIERLPEQFRPLFKGPILQIDNLVADGRITRQEAVTIKAMLYRAYSLNPEIILGLTFESLTESIKGGAEAERAGDQFTIRIGSNFRSVAKDNPLTAIEIFAHEIAHIARLKFIADNSNEFNELMGLYQSKEGKVVLKKAVLAWHGGVWTKEARTEFEKYIDDPTGEEFIAGFTSLYLLADVAPVIRDLNKKELTIFGKTVAAVKRIFSYISTTMGRLQIAFHTEDPEFNKAIRRMSLNVFGYDSGTDGHRSQFDSTAVSDARFGWDAKHKGSVLPKVDVEKDLEILRLNQRYVELKESESRTSDEETELNNIINTMTEDPYASSATGLTSHGGEGGTFTRWEYITTLDTVKEKYAPQAKTRSELEEPSRNPTGSGIIDFGMLMAEGTSQEKAAAFVYLNEALLNTYGEPVSRGLGAVANKMLSKGARDKVIAALIGNTGHESTWNSNFLIPIMLTTLIDDNIATVSGSFTNPRGTPSVRKILGELENFSGQMRSNKTTIVKLIQNKMTSLWKGEGVAGKKANLILETLNIQVIESVSQRNETEGKYEFDLSEKAIGVALDEDVKKEIAEQLHEMSEVFVQMALRNVTNGKAIGEFGEGFTSVVPYRLGTSLDIENISGEAVFVDTMKGLISQRLLTKLDESGMVEGTILLANGTLPHLTNDNQAFNDLKKLKDNFPSIYGFLLESAVDQLGGDRDRELRVRSLDNRLQSKEFDALIKIRHSSLKLMNQLTKGNITLHTLFKDSGTRRERQRFETEYKHMVSAAKESSDNVANRLEGLTVKSYEVSPNIKARSTVKAGRIAKSLGVPRDAITHIFRNFLERSAVGAYYPNDNFALPEVNETLQANEQMKKYFVVDITSLSENARHGLYNETAEKLMMREFGAHATVSQVLDLVESVNTSSYGILDAEGNSSREQTEAIKTSVEVLRNKHDTIRKIRNTNELKSTNILDSAVPEYGNAITRISFGGNLFMATTIVENGFAALDELLGRGNITGFVRSAFAPFSAITNRKERARVLKDHAYLIDSMTQGFLPEFEKPFGGREDSGPLKFLKGWGSQQMRLAKWQLKNISAARAVNLRSYIQSTLELDKKGNRPLIRLAEILENPSDFSEVSFNREISQLPMDKQEAALKEALRVAGISSYANLGIITYLMKAGLLRTDKLNMLLEMMPENGRYSPFEMSHELFSSHSETTDTKDYNDKLDIITGLKEAERSYIEEAILAPNAFDTQTQELGTAGALFEIYRRYPVLFVSQQLIRKSSRASPMRAGMGLASLLLLDIMYMVALQLAAGVTMDEIIEEFEQNGFAKTTKLIARTPLMGRYLAMIAPIASLGAKAISEGKMFGAFDLQRELAANSGFIPLAALGQGLGAGITGIQTTGALMGLNDMPVGQDILNATRVIPGADAALRLSVYSLAGDGIERKDRRSSSRSTRSGGVGTNQVRNVHYGMRQDEALTTWEYYARDMYKEVLGEGVVPQAIQEYHSQLQLMNSLENTMAPPAAQTPAPPEPAQPEITTSISKPENIVEAIIDRKPEKAPEGLLDS